MAVPDGEVDCIDVFSLPGDAKNEFHVVCATSASFLISILARVDGGAISMVEEWRREAGSRSWHVAADVPESTAGPAFFTAREDGHFHAYSVDGSPCWSHDFSATVSEFKLFADPSTGERLLIVPSLDKTLRLLHADNGRLAWGDTFQSGVNVVDQRLLDGGEKHVIVAGGNDHTLRCYARNTHDKPGAYRMQWFHKFASYVRDVSISPDGRVAAVADDGFLKLLDASTGRPSWQYEHNSFAWKCKVLPGANRVVSSSYQLPLAVDETGQMLGNPGVVICHDLDRGDLIWKTLPDDGINASALDVVPAGGQDLLLLGTTRGDVLVMDVPTGRTLRGSHIPHPVNRVGWKRVPGGQLAVIGCQECDVGSLFAGIVPG